MSILRPKTINKYILATEKPEKSFQFNLDLPLAIIIPDCIF